MAASRKRRVALAIAGIVFLAVAYFIGVPAFILARAWWNDHPVEYQPPTGMSNDASRLSETKVTETWNVSLDTAQAEEQLRALLQRAESAKLPVSIAGAQHSMGGHTIAPDGIVVNMLPFNAMQLEADKGILHVGSGARWFEIVSFLNQHHCSVAVMQSNNDFSVGGSISVNCHGWQHNQPPIASTVESFRIMLADGTVQTCSRSENTELFGLVLGGYGLFGIVLDVNLRIVPNVAYRADVEYVRYDQYTERFRALVDGSSDAGMVYGRLRVVPGETTFLRDAILTVYRKVDCKPEEIPPLKVAGKPGIRRVVYRAQIGSDRGKALRWQLETMFGERKGDSLVSRNQLINEHAQVYQERNADRTDILHEYFIPTAAFARFLDSAHEIIPRHKGDLLNVTVRNLKADPDSFLRYADQDMFAFVLLFNQEQTPEAESSMQAMTRELIDAAIACGGRYYLPYRLHATQAQFEAAYPRAAAFFELKRKYDPNERFQNSFYRTYGALATVPPEKTEQ